MTIASKYYRAGQTFYSTEKGFKTRSAMGISKVYHLLQGLKTFAGREFHIGTLRFKSFARGFNSACTDDGERTIYG